MTKLIQNTKDWHQWRKKGLGASDANVIMGMSKFQTVLELYNEKVSEEAKERKDNFITNKGHRLEIKARAQHELDTMMDFPPMLAEHSQKSYLRASLDGCNQEEKILLEIKYCGEDDYQLVEKGIILEQYKPQIMHQFLVTGYDKLHLRVITEQKDENGKQIKGEFKSCFMVIEPDINYIDGELLPALDSFWASVENKEPPALSKDDNLTLTDKGMIKNFKEYKKILQEKQKIQEDISILTQNYTPKLEEADEKLKALKALISKKQLHCRMSHDNLFFYQYERNGSINYEKAFYGMLEVMCEFGVDMINKIINDEMTFEIAKESFIKQKEWAVNNLEKFRRKSSTVIDIKLKEGEMPETNETKKKAPAKKKKVAKKKVAKKVTKKKATKKKTTKKKVVKKKK